MKKINTFKQYLNEKYDPVKMGYRETFGPPLKGKAGELMKKAQMAPGEKLLKIASYFLNSNVIRDFSDDPSDEDAMDLLYNKLHTAVKDTKQPHYKEQLRKALNEKSKETDAVNEEVKQGDIKTLEKLLDKIEKSIDDSRKLAEQLLKETDALYKKSADTGITLKGHKRKFLDLKMYIDDDFLDGSFGLVGAVRGVKDIRYGITEIKKLL